MFSFSCEEKNKKKIRVAFEWMAYINTKQKNPQ